MPSNTGSSPSGAATASAAARVNAPAEDREAPKEGLFRGGEQVVAPGDGVAHRALPCRQVAAAAGQQRATLLQPGQQVLRAAAPSPAPRPARWPAASRRDAGRCAATAAAFSAVSANSAFAARARSTNSATAAHVRQVMPAVAAVWIGEGQRRHRELPLGPDVQRLPAGGQDDRPRAGCQQGGNVGRGLQHLLAVIEHQQEPRSRRARLSVSRSGIPRDLTHAQRGGDRRYDEGRIGQRGEIDEADAIGVAVGTPAATARASRVFPFPRGR